MELIKQTFEVRVSRTGGRHWNLFAMYPNRMAAYESLNRAKAQGYDMAVIIDKETVSLKD